MPPPLPDISGECLHLRQRVIALEASRIRNTSRQHTLTQHHAAEIASLRHVALARKEMALRKVEVRIRNRAISMWFGQWRGVVMHAKRCRVVVSKVVGKWMGACVYGAFENWHTSARVQKKAKMVSFCPPLFFFLNHVCLVCGLCIRVCV